MSFAVLHRCGKVLIDFKFIALLLFIVKRIPRATPSKNSRRSRPACVVFLYAHKHKLYLRKKIKLETRTYSLRLQCNVQIGRGLTIVKCIVSVRDGSFWRKRGLPPIIAYKFCYYRNINYNGRLVHYSNCLFFNVSNFLSRQYNVSTRNVNTSKNRMNFVRRQMLNVI